MNYFFWAILALLVPLFGAGADPYRDCNQSTDSARQSDGCSQRSNDRSKSATCLTKIGSYMRISAIERASDDTLLVGTWGHGLFRLEGDRLVPVFSVPSDIEGTLSATFPSKMVTGLHATRDGTLLVGVESELFRLDGDEPVSINHPQKDYIFYDNDAFVFHAASDGALLVGTQWGGLFRYAGDKLLPIGKDRDTGRIYVFHETADGASLVGTGNGLFRRAGDNLARVEADQETGRVLALHETRDGPLLVGTSKGLFRLSAGKLATIDQDYNAGEITGFYNDTDGALLVGTIKGLFRLEADKLVPIGTDQDVGAVNAFHAGGDGTLLVVTSKGLFRREANDLVRIGMEKNIGEVFAFHTGSDGTLLVGASKGLFRLTQGPCEG